MALPCSHFSSTHLIEPHSSSKLPRHPASSHDVSDSQSRAGCLLWCRWNGQHMRWARNACGHHRAGSRHPPPFWPVFENWPSANTRDRRRNAAILLFYHVLRASYSPTLITPFTCAMQGESQAEQCDVRKRGHARHFEYRSSEATRA